ncbi:hypothetical protein LL912_21880 [Niabella sp. CC-SYL272]|uniref:hypothetical protein n=1 Tax=Niabella agricola TaxID=2891571 RepID=UPI001F28A8BB|nr:hypothetical protein [Niabella agricola]MCF3111451.1 hypothetical protein [Niabella agricola]
MPSNRRVFLSSLAALAAGAALGQNCIAPPPAPASDLELLWKALCRKYQVVPHNCQPEQKKKLAPCKGHTYKEAAPVFFPNERIIAQPVWIYWDCNPAKPSDVVIHCYQAGNAVASLNQFELKLMATADTDTSPKLTQYLQRNAHAQRISPARTLVYQRNKTTTVYV